MSEGNMLLCPRCQPTIYKFFYFKIEIKTKVDSYMPCKAMAHSPSMEAELPFLPSCDFGITCHDTQPIRRQVIF